MMDENEIIVNPDVELVERALYTFGPSLLLITENVGISRARVSAVFESSERLHGEWITSIRKISEAMLALNGNLSEVAAMFRVPRDYVEKWIDESTVLMQTKRNIAEYYVDKAEDQLRLAVLSGKEWAVEKVLNSESGKKRGYGDNRGYSLADEMAKLGIVQRDLRQVVKAKLRGADQLGVTDAPSMSPQSADSDTSDGSSVEVMTANSG